MIIRLRVKGFTLPSAFKTKQEDEVRTEARFSNLHLMKSLADKCFSFLKKKSLEPGSTETALIRTKLKRRNCKNLHTKYNTFHKVIFSTAFL